MVHNITTVFNGHIPRFVPQLNDNLYRQVTSVNIVSYINNFALNEPDNLPTSPPLYIAAVDTALSLLGSPRHGQATLYLLAKTFTLLSTHTFIAAVTVDVF